MGTGDTKIRNVEIIERLALGESSITIAPDFDIDSSTVRKVKQKNREEVERRAAELIETLPDIIEETKLKFHLSKKLTKHLDDPITYPNTSALQEIPDILQFSAQITKMQENVLRATGILPSQSPSFVFQQFYDQRTQTVVSKDVMDVCAKVFQSNLDDIPD